MRYLPCKYAHAKSPRDVAYEILVITVRLVIIVITVQFLERLVITVEPPVNAPRET